MRSVPRPVLLVVLLHAALVACYTLPVQWVPNRVRTLATGYAQGLFHQQWQLFAPDPPRCGCHLEWRTNGGQWTDPLPSASHYLHRRMLRSAAWNVQRELTTGMGTLSAPVQQAVRNLGQAHAPDADAVRLVERCVSDPARPAARVERTTPLDLP